MPVMNRIYTIILGFDPIKESHKGLSELINDEQQQQMSSNNTQRSSRMPPPPGFNHLQSGFNYGQQQASPRTQGYWKITWIITRFFFNANFTS